MASEAEAESNHKLYHLVISFKSMNLTSSQWLKTRASFNTSFIIFFHSPSPPMPIPSVRIIISNLRFTIMPPLSILDNVSSQTLQSLWLCDRPRLVFRLRYKLEVSLYQHSRLFHIDNQI